MYKYKNQYYAYENGLNSRIDELQSAILNFKLKKVDYFIKKRRELAKIYLKELKDTKLLLPVENKNNRHVYHLFTVYHSKRDLIIKHLLKKKIETRLIYPYTIQEMIAYKKIIKNTNRLKTSQKKSRGIFCLPLYPELKIEKVKFICRSLKSILQKLDN